MKSFAYTAYTAEGRVQRGVVLAEDSADASARIGAMGLLPGDIRAQAAGAGGGLRPGGRRARIGRDMLAVFTRQMAVLLGAGLALDAALAAVQDAAPDRRIQGFAAQLRAQLLEGAALSQAVALAARDLPPWYVAALAAAERSGEMAAVFDTLAEHLESALGERAQVTSALLYPAFVTVMAIAVCAILMVTVAPEIVGMFEVSGQPLPPLTLFVLGIVDGIAAYWPVIAVALGALVALVVAAARIPSWRAQRDRVLLRLPLVGRLMRMAAAAQYLRTLALVINSRVPLPQALEHAGEGLSVARHRAQARGAVAALDRGDSLARALGGLDFLHPVERQLLETGESSARLGPMSSRAAQLAESWLRTERKRLSVLLEPLSMIVVGAMVLVIVLAILLPIFDMQGMVGG